MENALKNDFLKLYRSKILITQNFMLIAMQETVFDFNHYILRVCVWACVLRYK